MSTVWLVWRTADHGQLIADAGERRCLRQVCAELDKVSGSHAVLALDLCYTFRQQLDTQITHLHCVSKACDYIFYNNYIGEVGNETMTHSLTNECAKNYCNRMLIVLFIVESVVTYFSETRCIFEIIPRVFPGEILTFCSRISSRTYY